MQDRLTTSVRPNPAPYRFGPRHDNELQAQTTVLELMNQIEEAGRFVAGKINQDGGATLTPAEVTQLRLILGA